MAYFLVEKQGFKDSGAIFSTRKQAVEDAEKYWPDVKYRIRQISKVEALGRIEKFKKRLKGKVPQSRIDAIRLPVKRRITVRARR